MNNTHPLISIIIPTHNRKSFIQTAIASVLSQTFKDYEVIVIDDASTDGTSDYIKSQYPDFALITLAQNVGAAEARNRGLQVAKGEFIAFLDSDDQWDAHYLEAQIETLRSHPHAAFVFCNHTELYGDGTSQEIRFKPSSRYSDLMDRALKDIFIFTMSVVMVRKAAIAAVGPLDPTLRICHDREFYLRLLCWGEMLHHPALLVTRVMHSHNISSDYQEWGKYALLMFDVFFDSECGKPYQPLEAEVKRYWAIAIARRAWQNHHAPLAAWMLLKAFGYAPQTMTQKIAQKLIEYTPAKP